jgi:hypothetical protein
MCYHQGVCCSATVSEGPYLAPARSYGIKFVGLLLFNIPITVYALLLRIATNLMSLWVYELCDEATKIYRDDPQPFYPSKILSRAPQDNYGGELGQKGGARITPMKGRL